MKKKLLTIFLLPAFILSLSACDVRLPEKETGNSKPAIPDVTTQGKIETSQAEKSSAPVTSYPIETPPELKSILYENDEYYYADVNSIAEFSQDYLSPYFSYDIYENFEERLAQYPFNYNVECYKSIDGNKLLSIVYYDGSDVIYIKYDNSERILNIKNNNYYNCYLYTEDIRGFILGGPNAYELLLEANIEKVDAISIYNKNKYSITYTSGFTQVFSKSTIVHDPYDFVDAINNDFDQMYAEEEYSYYLDGVKNYPMSYTIAGDVVTMEILGDYYMETARKYYKLITIFKAAEDYYDNIALNYDYMVAAINKAVAGIDIYRYDKVLSYEFYSDYILLEYSNGITIQKVVVPMSKMVYLSFDDYYQQAVQLCNNNDYTLTREKFESLCNGLTIGDVYVTSTMNITQLVVESRDNPNISNFIYIHLDTLTYEDAYQMAKSICADYMIDLSYGSFLEGIPTDNGIIYVTGQVETISGKKKLNLQVLYKTSEYSYDVLYKYYDLN